MQTLYKQKKRWQHSTVHTQHGGVFSRGLRAARGTTIRDEKTGAVDYSYNILYVYLPQGNLGIEELRAGGRKGGWVPN